MCHSERLDVAQRQVWMCHSDEPEVAQREVTKTANRLLKNDNKTDTYCLYPKKEVLLHRKNNAGNREKQVNTL